jgi:hypothetical protein
MDKWTDEQTDKCTVRNASKPAHKQRERGINVMTEIKATWMGRQKGRQADKAGLLLLRMVEGIQNLFLKLKF